MRRLYASLGIRQETTEPINTGRNEPEAPKNKPPSRLKRKKGIDGKYY
jgi:hypothetical protein